MKASLFDTDDLQSRIKAFETQSKALSLIQSELETLKLKIRNSNSQIEVNTQKIDMINEDIAYYNANVEAYENLESLRRDLQAITKTTDLKKSEIKKCEDKVLGYMSEKGSAIRAIEEAKERIDKIKEAERDYIAYDIFVQATHPNGISYEVIKSMLPVINSEIQKILSPIVEFNVFFDNEGDKLEIYSTASQV
jgi:chromosome segregation ATPase